MKHATDKREPLRAWFNVVAFLISWALFRLLLSADWPEKFIMRDLQFLNRWFFVFLLVYTVVACAFGYGAMNLLYAHLKTKKPFADLNRNPLLGKINVFVFLVVLAYLLLSSLYPAATWAIGSAAAWAPFVAAFAVLWGAVFLLAFLLEKREVR